MRPNHLEKVGRDQKMSILDKLDKRGLRLAISAA